jgi:hypothetical protein
MLTDIVETYLSVRRALGFKLQSVEKYLSTLRSSVSLVEGSSKARHEKH